ncbi:MAG: LPS assembly protein LptD [Proteobacteria bacterium]|nr:LPS assembly protein LptD [Pseudomonadota bacterium]
MSSKPLISACLLLAALNAAADEPLSCRTSLAGPLAANPFLPATALGSPDTIQLEAGKFEAQIGDLPTAVMSGGVLLRRDDKLVAAESARYDPVSKALHLEGGVRYEDPGTQILSRSAEFGYVSGRIRFEGAEFSLGSSNSRGAADVIEINQDGKLTFEGVEYTTCPPGSEDWLMQGRSIELDTRKGVGTARGMKLKFKGIPILYAPYLSFPIGDARKSGVLTPEIGSSGRSGNELRVPWYWNIAPNYDATITPRLLTSRGLQIATEFRYLTERSEGLVVVDYLPDDDIIDAARHQIRFEHRTWFGNGWRNQISLRDVSDSQYYEDLGGSLSISSITHLNRSLRFDYYSDNFSVMGQLQDYQTIDDAILDFDEPYRRIPQILVNGRWTTPFGLRFGINGEIVNFDRDVGVTGWRINASPKLDLPVSKPGWFINPAIAFDYTRYDLKDRLPGEPTDPTRSVPIASLDTGLILERTMNNSNRIQTIEPRLLYVHIPQRDQDGLPVFDTIAPDINLVQLYRKNRYLGIDRIGDTDHISAGITSRILDTSTGRELLSATIGQTRYFSDRTVALPGAPMTSTETSDYIAQLRFLLFKNVDFDFGHQWGSDTTKSEARIQYRPATNKVLNLAYRFRRDSLEQGDLSWSWPLSTRWNFVGRYNYSIRDEEVLEQFFGLEYESCCWGLRLVSRRYISKRDGTRDSSFGLQLVLKGMMSVGTAADRLLERGILGYSADLR